MARATRMSEKEKRIVREANRDINITIALIYETINHLNSGRIVNLVRNLDATKESLAAISESLNKIEFHLRS